MLPLLVRLEMLGEQAGRTGSPYGTAAKRFIIPRARVSTILLPHGTTAEHFIIPRARASKILLAPMKISLAPHKHELSDVPRCGALSLLQKPLHYRDIQHTFLLG